MKKLEVRKSLIHGKGVFATEDIQQGELLETCPYVILPIKKGELSDLFADYRFTWPNNTDWKYLVLPLGYGCIYNHSFDNNAHFISNEETDMFEFYARRDIRKGEEILTYYGDVCFNN